jgi:glycosyltransferase involved in cell wall biosynthesis
MKYSFVIPTLNGAKVLQWSIGSCLAQVGTHDLEVIVSDNASIDDTPKVVASFNDLRVKYVRTAKRLSMSANWNHAYSHVSGDVVMYLGDDDIVNPQALNIAEGIFARENVAAISRTSGYYHTPDCDSPFAGYLVLPDIDGTYELRNASKVLQDVARFARHYADLPNLYHGFVQKVQLDKLLSHGALFRKASPDIFSDINIASLGIDYACVSYPLTLGVASPKSNGLNFSNNTPIGAEFVSSSLSEFTHNYSLFPITLQVIDCLEEVSRANGVPIVIDRQACYRSAIKESQKSDIEAGMRDLCRLSDRSPSRVWVDWIRNQTSPRGVVKAIVGRRVAYKIGQISRHLKRRFSPTTSSAPRSFSFCGDLRKLGIRDPLQCLAFIEDRVGYLGRRR